GPGLQGAGEHGYLAHLAATDGPRQGGRARGAGRGDDRIDSDSAPAPGPVALGLREASVPAAQLLPGRAGAVHDPAGHVVPGGTADADATTAAEERTAGERDSCGPRGGCGNRSANRRRTAAGADRSFRYRAGSLDAAARSKAVLRRPH